MLKQQVRLCTRLVYESPTLWARLGSLLNHSKLVHKDRWLFDRPLVWLVSPEAYTTSSKSRAFKGNPYISRGQVFRFIMNRRYRSGTHAFRWLQADFLSLSLSLSSSCKAPKRATKTGIWATKRVSFSPISRLRPVGVTARARQGLRKGAAIRTLGGQWTHT